MRVTLRPLAGTRRRGTTPEEDPQLESELIADPKEVRRKRAEEGKLMKKGGGEAEPAA